MADSFRWPLDDSEVEALDIERGTIIRPEPIAPPPRQVQPDPDLTVSAAPPTRRERHRARFRSEHHKARPVASVLDGITNDDSRDSPPDLANELPGSASVEPTAVSDATANLATSVPREPRRFASIEFPWRRTGTQDSAPLRPSWTLTVPKLDLSSVRQFALPVLALIAVVESGWLMSGYFIKPSPNATIVTSSAPQRTTSPSVLRAPEAPTITATTGIGASPTSASSGTPSGVESPRTNPGSVLLSLPFQVQVYEDRRFVGISNGQPVTLNPGSHNLELLNDSLDFKATLRVIVRAGRTTRAEVPVPSVRVQLNAAPWAEVIVDGKSVGETPLGNVPMTIGPHSIVFRHPQLGEKTRTVLVTAQSPVRISVDLRQ